jgi:predicted DNA binding protein
LSALLKVVQEFDSILEELNYLRKRVAELEAAPMDNRKKLTEREVRDIREAYRGGMRQKDLADNYGVNPATISRTVRGIYH